MANINQGIYPYPYMFDPTQWSNKYSQFNTGTQLPGWPTQYQGIPTDAHGNPIQSYLDALNQQQTTTTMAPPVSINTTPQPIGSQTFQNIGSDTSAPQYARQGGSGGMGTTTMPIYSYAGMPSSLGQQKSLAMMGLGSMPGSSTGQGQGQPVTTTTGPDMNAAYLAALSNPGKVITPGATVPQGPTPSGQSGVLQQFLANWQQGGQPTTGAGNYNNRGFYNALQGNV